MTRKKTDMKVQLKLIALRVSAVNTLTLINSMSKAIFLTHDPMDRQHPTQATRFTKVSLSMGKCLKEFPRFQKSTENSLASSKMHS